MPPNDAASLASGRAATTHAPPHVAVVGHVDHGKSTIVGRLLADTDNLPEGKVAAVEATCRRRGLPFEWAFVTDALQAERDQGVTVEVSHIGLRLEGRPIVLVDAPGHREFLKNMISGAARCDAALLVVDAGEGVQEQSRRHAYLLHLLGVGRVIVAVNKMDRAGFDAARFEAVAGEIGAYLRGLGVEPTATIPVSGREGDGITAGSERMPWYDGPSLAQALAACGAPTPSADRPLRLPVQDVYRMDDRRIIVGRVESGTLQPGDRILVSPSNQTSTVATLEAWGGPAPARVVPGQSVGLTLADPLYVERGDLLSHETSPPAESDVFRGRVFWIGRAPLVAGGRYTLKLHTAAVPVTVQTIEAVIDTATLAHRPGDRIARNEVGEVVLRTRRLLAFDPHDRNRATGRFVLVDGYDVAGGGLVSLEGYPDQRGLVTVKSTNVTAVAHRVSADQRLEHNGHSGGVLWLTGLSGAGKSTVALALEQRLFAEGYQVYVLDGDNVRQGLNANLGFSPEDRAENIRRVGEVAALFADAGMIVITAFISPYRSDRSRARGAASDGMFHEVHVDAPLAECERRDPKGLYKRARAGEITDFTGVSAPYEPPEDPELRLDTAAEGVAQSVERLAAYVRKTFGAPG